MKLLSLIVASFLTTLAAAIKIQGSIIPNAVISGKITIKLLVTIMFLTPSLNVSNIDFSTTKVTLNGAQHTAHIRSDGSFVFWIYLLEVQSIDNIFPKLRVDVNEQEEIQASYTGLGISWNQRGYNVDYPLQIQAKAEAEYFMERQKFNVIGMFKNPMFLMLGFSAIMMFFMPKMMEQMKNMGM
ncbi:unnamed protein product [Mucor hiemalis]